MQLQYALDVFVTGLLFEVSELLFLVFCDPSVVVSDSDFCGPVVIDVDFLHTNLFQ